MMSKPKCMNQKEFILYHFKDGSDSLNVNVVLFCFRVIKVIADVNARMMISTDKFTVTITEETARVPDICTMLQSQAGIEEGVILCSRQGHATVDTPAARGRHRVILHFNNIYKYEQNIIFF